MILIIKTQLMPTKELEMYMEDLENKKRDILNILNYGIGYDEVKKIVKELHIETYKRLLVMKSDIIKRHDELRGSGLSWSERMKIIGSGKYEWIEKRLGELKASRLIIPKFEDWVEASDYDMLARKGPRDFVRFFYQLGYFK